MSFLNLRLVFITNLIILPFIILTLPKPIVRPADLPASCHELRPITTPAAGSPTKPHAERTYDVVIYGATGFTGRLAALYMQSAAPTGTTWAIAGRSQAKLDKMNAELEHPVPTVIADSSDEEAVRAMVESTRVIMTTVGPYVNYGSLVLGEAAKAGTHYLDLSGEFFWQADMVELHHATAASTGAKIVVAAGYDSVPFDLGALVATNALLEAHAKRPTQITSVVTQMRGLASGGTISAVVFMMQAMMKGQFTLAQIFNPYLLVDDVDGCRVDSDPAGWSWASLPRYDSGLSVLAIPHFMAWANARVVRRSLALAGSRNCSYGEGMSVGAMADATGWVTSQLVAGNMTLGDLAPSPGQGPPQPVLDNGGVKLTVQAAHADELAYNTDTVVATVAVTFAGDPGYAATSKMLVEGALCLADAKCHAGSALQGGVLTPATAMGTGLVGRLQAAMGGTFASFEVLPPAKSA